MKAFIFLCCVAVALASKCGENQHYDSCGTQCPVTCDNVNDPPSACILSCNSGCHCDEGFVKTNDGRCVRAEDCPSRAQEVCDGEHEEYQECGTACPLTCDNYNNRPIACVKMCKTGCACKEGFVRSSDGRCVVPEQCGLEQVCNGENEEYKNCGTACPLTCDNYKNQPIACVKICKTGCACKNGFVRSSDGRCVEPEQCDTGLEPKLKSCLGKPDPGPCRASFPMWYYNVKTGKCHEFVYGGCQGNGNRYGNEKDCLSRCEAVRPKSADVELCAQPAETGPCRAYFQRYAFNQATGECEKFVYGGCRGNKNNFRTIEECHNTCLQKSHEKCGVNEHYDECGSACPLTCANVNDPPKGCVLSCNAGCHCDEGHVRNEHGQCVRPDECVGRSTEELCALPSEPGVCRGFFVRFHYDVASGECKEFVYGGCGGNENNFETKEACHSSCLQKASGQCPANEHFEECGTACPKTCDNLNDPPRGCVLSCNAGCFCDAGHVRNSEGLCVKESACQNNNDRCGENREFNKCGTACPDTCENYLEKSRVCTMQCVIGCQCKKGFVLRGETCVRPEECEASQYGQEWRPDCDKKGEKGLCMAYIERWYYDQEEGMCKKFIYGGCGGNKNNFGSEFDCYNKCGAL